MRNKPLLMWLCVAHLGIAPMAQTVLGQGTKDEAESLPSIETVVAGMRRNFDPVRQTLRIRYRRDNKSFVQGRKTGWPWVEIDFAVKGQKRYLKHTKPRNEGAHVANTTDLWIYDGETFRALNTRTASGWVEKSRNGYVDYDLYCYLMFIGGLFEHDFPEVKNVKSFFWLPEPLTNGSYQVSRWEQQGGQRCILIENPDLDKIWVDPGHGYNVVRRELRERKGDPLKLVSHTSDFRKLGLETWLPYRVVWEVYGVRDDPANAGRVVEERAITVANATLDPQPDSLFVLVYPTGATVINGETNVAYKTVAPHENPFDSGVAQAISENPPIRRGNKWAALMVILTSTLATLFVIYLKLKQRGRRKGRDVA